MPQSNTTSLYEIESLPELRQATLFYEKYEPREQLGTGISSVVRRCICRENNQEYAVKIIDLSLQSANNTNTTQNTSKNERNGKDSDQDIPKVIDLEILQRVENEVHLLKKVRGRPNIIHMVESFKTSAYYFIVFELMHRGELFDYLTDEISLTETRCRKIMSQIFNALRILHDHRIIHRDVKMENVLIDTDLSAKLTDFGLSVQCGAGPNHLPNHLTTQDSGIQDDSGHDLDTIASPIKDGNTSSDQSDVFYDMVGTICYMSPEMLEACMFEDAPGYSYQIDMWACGVIMYTLLTGGKQPFYARKTQHLVRKIMNCDFSMDIPELMDISEEAKELIVGLLNPDPKKRLNADQALGSRFILKSRREREVFVRRLSSGSSIASGTLSRQESLSTVGAQESDMESSLVAPVFAETVDQGISSPSNTRQNSLESCTASNSTKNSVQEVQNQVQVSDFIQKSSFRCLSPLKKFKTLSWVIRASIRWRNLGHERLDSESLAELAKRRPYDHKSMRHLIDQATFNIYGHWLSRGGCDNSHALLFENSPKIVQERLTGLELC